jgi:phage tail sheath protein FI
MLDSEPGNNALTEAEFAAVNDIIDSAYNQAWNVAFNAVKTQMSFQLVALSDGDSTNSGNKVAALKGFTTTYDAQDNPDGDMEDLDILRQGSRYNIRWEVTNVDPLRGTFDVNIRRGDDSELRPFILESFSGVTLDPTQSNYIEKVIGTQYYTLQADSSGVPYLQLKGTYPNRSRFVRVIVNQKTLNYLTEEGFVRDFNLVNSLPNAFTPTFTGIINITGVTVNTPSTALTGTIAVTAGSTSVTGDGTTFLTQLKVGDVVKFGVTPEWHTVATITSDTALTLATPAVNLVAAGGLMRKVTLGVAENTDITKFSKVTGISNTVQNKLSGVFAFGSDGNVANPKAMNENIWEYNTQGLNVARAEYGETNYLDAIDMLSNKDQFDFDLLVTPGLFDLLPSHAQIISRAINMCEDRGDAFYIVDPVPFGKGVGDAQRAAEGRNSNYAGMYYPWVQFPDPNLGDNVWLPPSAVMPGVFAFNDYFGQKWFAPAGLNRGGIEMATQTERIMTQNDRDNLYRKNVNPIATFPRTGIAVWGQKTLQKKRSALDRINVRRLLIAAKRHVAETSKYLVFEQNTNETRNNFINITSPWFEDCRRKQGLYDFKIVIDEKNNGPEVVDRNEMRAQIYLKPAKTAEFLIVDFNILPTGAVFPVDTVKSEN